MLNAMSFTKILKIFAGKLCTIIRDDSVWYAKTHYYAPQNLTGYPADWLSFNPSCESIDRYNKKIVTTLGSQKRTQDVNAPSGE
jgi:hypothetical protein